MTALRISNDLELPAGYVTKTAAILAKRRIGKTYNASVIAEEFVEQGIPFVALDPTSAWWGLRAAADGKRAGLPVTIIGGEHGDVPITADAGKVLADLVVEEPGFYVLDLGDWETDSEHRRFAAPFLERLYRHKARHRDPLHLFVDEADVFAPQKPQKGDEKMLHNMQAIVRRGGIRGLGTTLITQRAAVLNKDVLTQLDLLIVLRTIAPQDQDAVDDYIKRGAAGHRDEIMASLASLAPGEAWIYGPGEEPPIVKRLQFRRRRTFNSSATPTGERATEPRALAAVDLDQLRERMAATIEKAKADDPRELRRQIKQLQAKLASPPAPERVEIPVLTDDARQALEHAASTISAAQGKMIDAIADASRQLGELVEKVGQRLAEPPPRAPSRPVRPIPARPRPEPQPAPDGGDEAHLKAGARRILETLAGLHPMRVTKAQVGTLTGFKITGGTFQTYWSTLKRAGYVLEDGSEVLVTEQGLERAGTVPPAPQTTAEMVEMWGARLKRGARDMLEALVDGYPDEWTKPQLAEHLGMTASGGTFQTYLSTLRRNGLAEIDGSHVRAGEALFITGGVRSA